MNQAMPDPTMGANRNLNDLNTSVTYFSYKRGDYIDWNVRSVLVLRELERVDNSRIPME